jgi:hypothetical protein
MVDKKFVELNPTLSFFIAIEQWKALMCCVECFHMGIYTYLVTVEKKCVEVDEKVCHSHAQKILIPMWFECSLHNS